jgi:phosphopantothenoylcysteine decarboxylase / phosphopantothenate---cysteine ligase
MQHSNPSATQQKIVILGVTGSIAAYKAADLASKLTQAGITVDTILTLSALKLITPLTFQSVTGRKAYTEEALWGGDGNVHHIALGLAGNLLLIAPATANTIAKLAQGITDNLLLMTALAARCPILIAPAMDEAMYNNPATQANIQLLTTRGVHFVGPGMGHMASGLVGLGRMAEPDEILEKVIQILA